MRVTFDVTPVGKPRMTKSDAWKKRPATTNYWNFKDDINAAADQVGFTLPDIYGAIFYVPMAKSWSKKLREQMRGTPHQQKPDKDNIEKALNDSLRGDDSGIWAGWTEKRWADTGSIEILTGEDLAKHLASVMSRREYSL